MDRIAAEDVSSYVGSRQAAEMETSTINRDLATLRRMLKLAQEWGKVAKIPKVRLLAGENKRERVVSPEEEALYLAAAAPLLWDFTVLELDCGLRPEEAHRLKWNQIRSGNIHIHTGKTKHSRRAIPASPRVVAMLERRHTEAIYEWVFPAPTKSGHINEDSLKKQHARAIKDSGIEAFVVYSLRHTCLTRWAESGMDVFTLKRLAGHADIQTTMRYVHMCGNQDREFLEKVWRGHKSGHSAKTEPVSITAGVGKSLF
jgi:integrase